jgi:hypothetical protein
LLGSFLVLTQMMSLTPASLLRPKQCWTAVSESQDLLLAVGAIDDGAEADRRAHG